jgi:DNA polymerase-3 subunit beta
MEFTVQRNGLLNELNLVQGVIEKKSTIPILANILLEADAGKLRIMATDLDVSICCGCSATVQSSGTMTVSARRLFDIVRLLPEDAEIHALLLENEWVQLRSGRSQYKIVGLPKENFPSIPQSGGRTLAIPGAVIRSMIQRTMFAITQEESRYSLNGALFVVLPQEVLMVATDGHRLALVSKSLEVSGLEGEIRALIPRKTMVEIQKMIGDQDAPVEFGRDENHLFFSFGERRLVSRILAGQFPNYDLVIPRDNDKLMVAPTRALADAIRRAAVMSDEKMRAVKMCFSSGKLELTASSVEAGEAREEVAIDYSGIPVDIGFNPLYWLDFLGACGSEAVRISVRDAETQGMLQPGEGAELDYRYVVMPMKF